MRVSRRLTLAICLLALAVSGREVMSQGPPPGVAPAPGMPPASMSFSFEGPKREFGFVSPKKVRAFAGKTPMVRVSWFQRTFQPRRPDAVGPPWNFCARSLRSVA